MLGTNRAAGDDDLAVEVAIGVGQGERAEAGLAELSQIF